jgi:hypothetical protein
MFRIICDICHGPHPDYSIPFSRKVNGDNIALEICGHCLDEISDYIDRARPHLGNWLRAKIDGLI